MTIDTWLQTAVADAERRGFHALKPLLEGLAQSTALLRRADFSPRADQSNADLTERAEIDGRRREPAPSAQDSPNREPRESIETLGHLLRTRATSALEILETCLRHIETKNTPLNAFILVTADLARQQAAKADAELGTGLDRGPLHGIPISLKDLIDVEGQCTTAASRVRARHVAAHDADVVTRLRQAGAVIVGKTNLHEFAFGTTNEDSAFGPARHPLDQSRSPGGSSGGSAISVASGMSIATIGTDTGGSIRIPAAACGLVGLKPTLGEVSANGVVPLSRTLDHVGPLARTVTDAWHVYRALCGQPDLMPLRAATPGGLRLAVPRQYFCDLLEPAVRTSFDAVVGQLQREGARIDDVEVAHAGYIAAVYLPIVLGEAAAYHAATLETMAERYTSPVRLRFEMARYVLAEDYLRARSGRDVLRNEVDRVLADRDAIVLPTLPTVAPRIGEPMVSVDGMAHPVRNLMLRLTQLFNITGHPAVSLPCGTSDTGLPIGLQLVGHRGETPALMACALSIERVVASHT